MVNPSQFQVPGDVSLDGQTQNFSALGSNFANGKGNATVFFSYQKTDGVLQGTRDFSSCALGASSAGFNCGGSGTSATGQFFTADAQRSRSERRRRARAVRHRDRRVQLRSVQLLSASGRSAGFNAFAHYDDAFPNVRVYTEFDFMDDHTVTQIAPSGLFGQSFTFQNSNPLLSQSFKDAMGITANTRRPSHILRRNIEGGGRQRTSGMTRIGS